MCKVILFFSHANLKSKSLKYADVLFNITFGSAWIGGILAPQFPLCCTAPPPLFPSRFGLNSVERPFEVTTTNPILSSLPSLALIPKNSAPSRMSTEKPLRNSRATADWEFSLLPSNRKLCGYKLSSQTNSRTVTVMVHGWLDNSCTWFDVFPHLDDDLSDVIALDLAGHGKSDHLPPDGHYIFMQYALDLAALLVSLKGSYEEIRLVGHSLGAGVCILAERAEVCKLSSMVLIEGIGPMTSEDGMRGLISNLEAKPISKVSTGKRGERKVPCMNCRLGKP